ncbi:hypothetical protein GCM10010388_50670 [Streptomyces mauvecolor]
MRKGRQDGRPARCDTGLYRDTGLYWDRNPWNVERPISKPKVRRGAATRYECDKTSARQPAGLQAGDPIIRGRSFHPF